MLKSTEETNSHMLRKRVKRSVWAVIAVAGIMLGQMAGTGSIAAACSVEDCPGNLYGSAGETFVHYDDNIYLAFDDGRDSLAGFDAQYDFYTVYVMVDGQLLDAGTMDAYAGDYAFAALNLLVGDDVFQWYDYLDIPAEYSVGLEWNRRYNSGADIYYFLRGIQQQDYTSDNSIVQLVMYNSAGQYAGLVDNVHLSIDYWGNELSTLDGCNKFYDTYRTLIDNGQYNPYRIMGDYGTTVRMRVSAAYSAVTPSGQPSSGSSASAGSSADKIDQAVAAGGSAMPDVSQEDVTGLFPDEKSLDNDVLANVRILTAGIYDTNVCTLLTTSLGMAIIGYLLFGKKES